MTDNNFIEKDICTEGLDTSETKLYFQTIWHGKNCFLKTTSINLN